MQDTHVWLNTISMHVPFPQEIFMGMREGRALGVLLTLGFAQKKVKICNSKTIEKASGANRMIAKDLHTIIMVCNWY